jgi:murein DD-endopeptidase MepM/ murein hydrolase activator NlpD
MQGSTVRQWGDAYGTHVVIRTGNGLWDVAYCHLAVALVVPGDKVKPGMIIGHTGHTGGSGRFGPHLHLEARPAGGRFGTDVNPLRVKRGVRT